MTDPLTELGIRRKLDQVLKFERAKGYGRPLSLIMIDVDNLKHINDAQGHLAGDEILIKVADRLRNHVRRLDLQVRLGGDEFLRYSKRRDGVI